MIEQQNIDPARFQADQGIIGSSIEIQEIIGVIMQVAPTDITVLITGESGVGKEIIAKAIHQASKRAQKPLVTVNCGAIPEGIIESELFGHEKGAFTGATEQRKGYFELADSGTIFLDEIGELPPATQVKFLRVLENGEFMRVGSSQTKHVDVRIIAATNRNLEEGVRINTFRADLYYRLRTVNIQVPPLRSHREDISELVARFIQEISERNHVPSCALSGEAMAILQNYSWPGNIRELKNVIESLLVMHPGGVISADDVKKLLQGYSLTAGGDSHLPVLVNRTSEEVERELIYRALLEMKTDIMDIKSLLNRQAGNISLPSYGVSEVNETHHGDDGESLTMDEMEQKLITNALDKYLGNRRRAARALKISERTLYRKIKEYGIQG